MFVLKSTYNTQIALLEEELESTRTKLTTAINERDIARKDNGDIIASYDNLKITYDVLQKQFDEISKIDLVKQQDEIVEAKAQVERLEELNVKLADKATKLEEALTRKTSSKKATSKAIPAKRGVKNPDMQIAKSTKDFVE